MKKKVLFLVMSLCIMLLTVGCGSKGSEGENDTKDPVYGEDTTEDKADDATEDTTDDTTDDTADETADELVPVTKGEYVLEDYITLGQYKGIEVTVEQLEVTDEDIDATIQADLEANPIEKEITDRAVESGDIVNIDYEGLLDGEAFEGGTATDSDLTIGSDTFIPGFEEGLIGANVGDEMALDITFPEEYLNEDLAGQAVVFNVIINAIKISEVSELTEEYVQENKDFDTIEAYKESVRESLEAQNEQTMNDTKVNNVFTTIVDNSEIDSFPQTLIDYYVYDMKNYYSQYAASFGMDFASFIAASGSTEEDFDVNAQAYAESMTTQELIIKAIIKEEEMELTDDEYQEGVTKIMSDYNFASEDELYQSISEEQIEETLLWEKVMEYVTDEAVEL